MGATPNRRVWVVGSTSGIGAEAGRALAEAGYEVYGFGRSIGRDIDAAGVLEAAFAEAVPWAWIHCPGDYLERPLLDTGDAEWSALLDSNLLGFVRMARRVLPVMADHGGGRVVAFGAAGVGGGRGIVRAPAYFAAKAALASVVSSLAKEWAKHQVTCNLVLPGVIAHEGSSRQLETRLLARIPAGRLGKPRDLAGLVRLLVSDEGGYITGQELAVDGGLSLG